MPKTILWIYIQFAKDNSMDFWKTWHNWQWYAALKSFEAGKVFCDSIPNVGGKKGSQVFAFSPLSTGYLYIIERLS